MLWLSAVFGSVSLSLSLFSVWCGVCGVAAWDGGSYYQQGGAGVCAPIVGIAYCAQLCQSAAKKGWDDCGATDSEGVIESSALSHNNILNKTPLIKVTF